jgi:Mrp family chromosome partitioning ATPase
MRLNRQPAGRMPAAAGAGAVRQYRVAGRSWNSSPGQPVLRAPRRTAAPDQPDLHAGRPALRSIMVTSAMAAEGKTTTAANLAVTFAQQGLNVVMVDADLRRARVHRIFDVERSPGWWT